MAEENDERVRPTASNRAKRKAASDPKPQEPASQLEQQQPEHVVVEDDDLVDSSSDEAEEEIGDEESEQDEEEAEGEEKEGDEERIPQDDDVPNESQAILSPPLLKGFQTHVAKQIYQGVQRDPLRCHSHVAKLLAWKVDDDNGANGGIQGDFRQFREALSRAKLLRIRYSSYKNPNKNLISAFVERWHPETNSFHLPFGEMTITLDDVFCLTGLRVDGDPVQPSPRKKGLGKDDLEHYLGLTKKEATEALGNGRVRTCSVQLTWLRKKFMPMMKSDNEDEVLYAARAYVLYTFGTTLFADKSGGRVSTSWLEYTADMAKFHKYAWGTATLAYLYRQLGMASQSKCRQIGGYLTLLEAWIYERFSTLILPPQNGDFAPNLPVSMKYAPEAHTGPCIDRVRSFRELIDDLLSKKVSIVV